MTKQNNAASLAVKPLHCPNCWHDPAPVDVFDRIQEQARAKRRATCACGQAAEIVPFTRSKVIEALEVIECVAEDIATDDTHGLRNLAEWLDMRFEEHESSSTPPYAALAADTASVLAVLALVNEQQNNRLLQAAQTILTVAMQMLEDVSMVTGGAA